MQEMQRMERMRGMEKKQKVSIMYKNLKKQRNQKFKTSKRL